jgi:hypothetical protein
MSDTVKIPGRRESVCRATVADGLTLWECLLHSPGRSVVLVLPRISGRPPGPKFLLAALQRFPNLVRRELPPLLAEEENQ